MRPADPAPTLSRARSRSAPRFLLAALAACALRAAAQTPPFGPVVINEIFYHPPDELPGVQWVEVLNRSAAPVDLAGWSFAKGIEFKFPAGARLAPGALAVVAADAAAFQRVYGTNVPIAGTFAGRLSGKGERIELRDAAGKASDWVHYHDAAPWSVAADGAGNSLERIHADSRSDIPGNWIASPPGRGKRPAGTPGKPNAGARTNLPPIASDVAFDPLPKDKPNRVSVRWNDADGIRSASVEYRVGTADGWGARRGVPMTRVSGDAAAGEYAAEIPATPEGSVVRFRLRASDGAGNERVWPPENELFPEFSYLALARPKPGTIGQLALWTQGRAEGPGPSLHNMRAPRRVTDAVTRDLTAVYVPPAGGGDPELHDFVRIASRSGGWKVKTGKGRPLMGMHSLNVIFESSPRWVLAEHLSYELFRRSRVPAPDSGHVRVSVDGQDLGYHLYIEQPDTDFLRRRDRDPAGNLYKIVWFENGLARQHEKKNNPLGKHEDLKATVNGLSSRGGADQWALIQREFDVAEVTDYYVVSQCIQNWDGYFNNHYVYRAPGPAGRWQVFPWDEDKTWGDYDGVSPKYDWYTMPVTYGANGDRPPAGMGGFGGGGFGMGWWRPGGWFSGPLLANPGFRDQYRKRLREFCTTEFTEEKFRPVIDALEKRLEPEVRHRADVIGARVEPMLARFHADIESFRRQLAQRREFILREVGK